MVGILYDLVYELESVGLSLKMHSESVAELENQRLAEGALIGKLINNGLTKRPSSTLRSLPHRCHSLDPSCRRAKNG